MQQPIFEHGEAEHQVREMRRHLRDSHRLDAENQATQSQISLWRAFDIRDDLLKRLSGRFWNATVTELKDYPSDAQEDAVCLMVESVAADLMNLEPTLTPLAYEKWFNAIVEKRILNALRTIRRQEKYMHFGRSLSLSIQDEDGEGNETTNETLENKGALVELEKVFDSGILSCFRRKLSPEQLQMVQMRVRYPDASAAQLARLIDVPERTARSRLECAKKLLVSIIRGAD